MIFRHLNVLLFAAEIGETEVYEFDLFVFNSFEYVGACGHAVSPDAEG